MTEQPRERLARALRDRRKELGMSQPDLAKASGVSVGTIQSAEGTRPAWSAPRSMPAILRALGWARGSDQLIMNGSDPIPLESEPGPTDGTDDPPPTDDLPLRVSHELKSGDLVDYDVVDLDEDMRMIVVVRRTPGSDAPDDVEARMRRWLRARESIRNLGETDEKTIQK